MKSQIAAELAFFFDFSDPLSYVISSQVEGWCKGSRLEVRWMPFRRSRRDSGDGADQRLDMAASFARSFGYPLFPRKDLDPWPALRASILARDAGSVSQFVMRVFQFWFATDLPPYADVLFDGLAVDCRIPPPELKAALRDDRHWTSEALSCCDRQARELGVPSAPALVSPNGEKIEFDQLDPRNPLDELLDALLKLGLSKTRTLPSRCYLPEDTDQPERFCHWCTCGRNPS